MCHISSYYIFPWLLAAGELIIGGLNDRGNKRVEWDCREEGDERGLALSGGVGGGWGWRCYEETASTMGTQRAFVAMVRVFVRACACVCARERVQPI